MKLSTGEVAGVIIVLVILGLLIGGSIKNANTNVSKMDTSTEKMYESIVIGNGN